MIVSCFYLINFGFLFGILLGIARAWIKRLFLCVNRISGLISRFCMNLYWCVCVCGNSATIG